jgi:hypothetical protein
LDFLSVFEQGARERVMARVPEASREVIENTPRSSWIGIEHDHFTIDAMIQIFGRDRAIRCWADSVASLVDRPLLRTFVSGMLGVFGRDPVRVVSLFPKGWPLVYRDCCELSMERAPDQSPILKFRNIAPLVRKHSNYLLSWHGACLGFASIAKANGHVDFVISKDAASADARFSWG